MKATYTFVHTYDFTQNFHFLTLDFIMLCNHRNCHQVTRVESDDSIWVATHAADRTTNGLLLRKSPFDIKRPFKGQIQGYDHRIMINDNLVFICNDLNWFLPKNMHKMLCFC